MSSLFGGGSSAPKTVAERPVQAMPDADDPRVLAEKRRAQEMARTRSGRASTLLSGEGDYGSDKLGQA